MISPDEARDVVQKDLEVAIGGQLRDGIGFRLDTSFADWEVNPLTNGASSTQIAVPWTWHGENKGLLGLDATGREVTLRGVTVVTEEAGGLFCQRYVDWLPALQEAGILLFTRPVREMASQFDDDDFAANPDLQGILDEIAQLRDEH